MLNNIYKTFTSSQIIEANIQSQTVWWQQQPIRSELSCDTSPGSPISEYNPSKQYLQASSIILHEWCYIKYWGLGFNNNYLLSTIYWQFRYTYYLLYFMLHTLLFCIHVTLGYIAGKVLMTLVTWDTWPGMHSDHEQVGVQCTLNRPYRLACQNFGKANRLAHVKILILFTIKVVDIII